MNDDAVRGDESNESAADPQAEIARLRAQLANLRLLANTVPVAIAYYEAAGRTCQMANRRYAEMFGFDERSIVGRPLEAVIGAAAAAQIEPYRHRVIEERTAAAYEREVAGADGITRIAEVRLLPHVDAEGTSLGAFVLIADITHHRRAEAALRESEERLAKFMQASEEGIVFHKDGYITDANPPLLALLGYTLDEMLGRLALEFIAPEAHQQAAGIMAAAAETSYDSIVLHKDGTRIPVQFIVRTMQHQGQTQRLTIVRDIRDRLQAEQRIQHLAHHDALTGLPNRLAFVERLERRMAEARASGESLALMFIDLDHFKRINDSLGHAVGDTVLKTAATRITEALRAGDMVGRFGGDEFLVLLAPRAGAGVVAEVGERLLATIGAPLAAGGVTISVTPSIGVALFPQDGATSAELIQHADQAMYRAKAGGRARCRFFEAGMAEAALAELALESRLAVAVREREFVLHFQPQVALAAANGDAAGAGTATGRPRLLAVEALVRWAHPQRGLLAPDEFIPLAEARRLILPIGAWVLNEALAAAARWRDSGAVTAPVAVNLAALQFQGSGFVDTIRAALAASGADGSMLEIELTERMLLAQPREARDALGALREMGVTITLDDFGTGHTSLAQLKDLPVQRLKMDRGFVAGLPGDEASMAIARAIVQMGHGLKLEVVAEGVETEAQRVALAAIGCDALQGHLLARPMSEAQWLQWLRGQAGANGL
ncbi:MAG: EAL domain-containing protein [Burkholderiaceae bacterium]|nr:EAL domain-containing protein [Burkholderiaceae bacterium]